MEMDKAANRDLSPRNRFHRHRGDRRPRLFQRATDRGEFGVELRPDALNHGDDRERDTAGDQAIFDSGRAGLIIEES
jgi:hypothetical protein